MKMALYVIRDDKGLEEAYSKKEIDALLDSASKLEAVESEAFTYDEE